MFDPDGKSGDSDSAIGARTDSNSTNRKSRKRRLDVSDEFTMKGQDQTLLAPTHEHAELPQSANTLFYGHDADVVLQGSEKIDHSPSFPLSSSLTTGLESDQDSPLFHTSTIGQEMFSSVATAAATSSDSCLPTIPFPGDAIGGSKFIAFANDKPNETGSANASTTAIGALMNNNTPMPGLESGLLNHTGRSTSVSSTFQGIDAEKQNQALTLPRQQSESSMAPELSMLNTSVSSSIPPSQLGSLSLGSDLGTSRTQELLRNIQLQQQHLLLASSRGITYPSLNTPMNPLATTTALNASIPLSTVRPTLPISSNSIPTSQLMMPNILPSLATNSIAQPYSESQSKPAGNLPNAYRTADAAAYNCEKGRSKPLYLPCDSQNLSEYQCLLRQQIELFEASDEDIRSSTKGRNKPIYLGQVGVRCIHCRAIKPEARARGATYYPATLGAMYQSGQTMAIRHLRHNCTNIPREIREYLFTLKDGKSSAGGGKKYWSDAASVLGIYVSDEGGLRFRDEKPAAKPASPSKETSNNT